MSNADFTLMTFNMMADVMCGAMTWRDTLQAAKEAGLRTVGGDRLLYHQGLLAFKLWTGLDYKE